MLPDGTAVVKKEQVRLAGLCRVGSPSASPAEANGPAARIVSQDDQGAMVEVTCACGRKTVLRCRFPQAGGQAPAG